MDLKTFKEKLEKSGRKDELRAKLLKLKECQKKVQDILIETCLTSPKEQNLESSSPISYETSKVSSINSPPKSKDTTSPHRYMSSSSLDIEGISLSESPTEAVTPIEELTHEELIVSMNKLLLFKEKIRPLVEEKRALDMTRSPTSPPVLESISPSAVGGNSTHSVGDGEGGVGGGCSAPGQGLEQSGSS